MGVKFFENLGGLCFYNCDFCGIYLSNKNQILSTNFTGVTGQAYLFKSVQNVRFGACDKREMLTGLHYVRDVFCLNCDNKLGWMYEMAINDTERYKEGAVTLEKKLIKKVDNVGSSSNGSTTTESTLDSRGARILEIIENSGADVEGILFEGMGFSGRMRRNIFEIADESGIGYGVEPQEETNVTGNRNIRLAPVHTHMFNGGRPRHRFPLYDPFDPESVERVQRHLNDVRHRNFDRQQTLEQRNQQMERRRLQNQRISFQNFDIHAILGRLSRTERRDPPQLDIPSIDRDESSPDSTQHEEVVHRTEEEANYSSLINIHMFPRESDLDVEDDDDDSLRTHPRHNPTLR